MEKVFLRNFDYFFFDLDGTLINSLPFIVKSFNYSIYNIAKIIIDEDIIKKNIGRPLEYTLSENFKEFSKSDIDRLKKIHIEHQIQNFKGNLTLFKGVKKALKFLKSEHKILAVITTRTIETMNLFMQELNISRFFDLFVTPENTINHKPGPEPALYAIEKLKADPQRTLFVGDAEFDIMCGLHAGIKTCLVNYEQKKIQIKPDYVINNLNELCT